MYHISDEYRVSNRRARYHYNRTRLLGLIPVGVSAAFLYFAGDYYGPLLYGSLGCAIAMHLMLWAAYEAHFGGRHTGWTLRKLERSDDWFPGFMIICQNGFFSITLLIFWFIICRLGFSASMLDHALLGLWVLVWPLLRVLRTRHSANPNNDSLETTYEFFRLLNIIIVAFLIASILTDMLTPGESYSRDANTDITVVGIALWMPATLIAVGCVVTFLDYLVRKRPNRRRDSGFDVL